MTFTPILGGLEVDPSRIRREGLHAAFLTCLLNGMYALVVLITLCRTVSERGWRTLRRPLLIIMIIMYIFALSMMIILWNARVDDVSDSQAADHHLLESSGPLQKGSTIVYTLASGTNAFLADCVMHQTWRCWALWNRQWSIISLPILLMVGEIATIILYFIKIGRGNTEPLSSGFLSLLYGSLSLAATLLLTFLIIYRIVSIGGVKRYRGVIEIVTESSALYSIALIIGLKFYKLERTTFIAGVPGAFVGQVSGLSSALVIARVSLGFARPDKSWEAPASGIQFRRSDGERAQASNGSNGDQGRHRGIEILTFARRDLLSGEIPEPQNSLSSFGNRTLRVDRRGTKAGVDGP